MTRSVRYQPILHTLYYTLHTGHAYCLSYRFWNNVVITTVIEMVELVEILVGRLGQSSVERVRYVINNLLHLVIVKYGDISLVLCISTRLRLVTILSLLETYLVILHADPCNKSYIYICVSVVCQITWNHVNQTRACSKSVLGGKIRPVTSLYYSFRLYARAALVWTEEKRSLRNEKLKANRAS